MSTSGPTPTTLGAPITAVADLDVLTLDTCVDHLAHGHVARLAFATATHPIVLPVNYQWVDRRTVERPGFVVIRTRPGNVIDGAPTQVALEIDEVDVAARSGWSVVVQGDLRRVDAPDGPPPAGVDPGPWLAGRDSWMVLEPVAITGRRVTLPVSDWSSDARAYL